MKIRKEKIFVILFVVAISIDQVNLETDMLGKYVKRYIGAYTKKGTLTMDMLTKAGF